MQIANYFNNSFTKKVLDFLFADKKEMNFTDSWLGKVLAKISWPKFSYLCLFLAVSILWFKGYLVTYLPFLSSKWLTISPLALAFIFTDKKPLKIFKAHLWYLGFLLVSAFSTLLALFNGSYLFLLLAGWLIFAQFFLGLLAGEGLKSKITFLKSLIFLSLPLSLIGIYQFLVHVKTPNEWISNTESIQTRAFAFFGSPNVFAYVLGIMAILSLTIFLKENKKMYLFSCALNLISLGLTFSRSAWLGAFLAFTFLLFFYKREILYLIPGFGSVSLLIPAVRSRIAATFSQNYLWDSFLDGRLWALSNGIYLFKKHFLLGTGPGSYGGELVIRSASPVYLEGIQNGYTALYLTDNQYLEILVQTGVLGILSFLGFFVAIFSLLMGKFKKKKDIIFLGAMASLLFFLIVSLFANALEFGAVSIPLAMILGATINES